MDKKIKIAILVVVGLVVFGVALYFGIRLGLGLVSSLALGGSGAALLGLFGLSAHASPKSGSVGSIQDVGKEALRAGQTGVADSKAAIDAGRKLAEATQSDLNRLRDQGVRIAGSAAKLSDIDAERARLDEDLGRLFEGQDPSSGH